MDVRGDQNFSEFDVADIGGRNDTTSIKNFAASASGFNSTNTTDLTVFGDGVVTWRRLPRAGSVAATT